MLACEDSLTFTAPLPTTLPAGGLRFDVCRNGACVERTITGSPARFTTENCDVASMTSCAIVSGALSVEQEFNDFTLTPDGDSGNTFTVDASAAPALANGDQVTVRLFDPATNTTYASASQTVTYDAFYPNGQSCDGTYSCKRATVAATAGGTLITEAVCSGDAPSCFAGCDASVPATCEDDGGWQCPAVSNVSCGTPLMAVDGSANDDASASTDAADAHD